MNRRGFLAGILAAAAAPAIVRADSLMRVVPRDLEVLTFQGVPIEFNAAVEWPGVWVSPYAGIEEIIATTIRARSAQIAASVAQRNALLARLRGDR